MIDNIDNAGISIKMSQHDIKRELEMGRIAFLAATFVGYVAITFTLAIIRASPPPQSAGAIGVEKINYPTSSRAV
ncbi:hypothetical protein OLZ32_35395 [Rhizobium sp. 1AS11]|uniref:hypothetical protein n=1 Tax=Rhizobium acaciae TaxID=2989736 RepID=UPI0012F867D7|nr:hypothetical protein [Rhizobium acaciae]MCW1414087.1 hypothetical protein [Rhizobium acaciae]MCW1745652.1 hypothetical protein [Rhizobium acaciae]MCW1749090.1 hypothetical protein [Rhizobium acaciae]